MDVPRGILGDAQPTRIEPNEFGHGASSSKGHRRREAAHAEGMSWSERTSRTRAKCEPQRVPAEIRTYGIDAAPSIYNGRRHIPWRICNRGSGGAMHPLSIPLLPEPFWRHLESSA